MNTFTTNVYEKLVACFSTESLLESIKELPFENKKQLEENFNMFIQAMLDKDILLKGEDSDLAANLDENLAKESDYMMEFKEYNDAQELLLADPIHEVKEDTGWTPEKDSIGYSKEETVEREKKMEEDK